MTELVPVHFVAYEDDAELEINNDDEPTVENHDELVNNGQTYEEVRAIERESAENYELDIVERGDSLWDDRFGDLDAGDSWRLDELT